MITIKHLPSEILGIILYKYLKCYLYNISFNIILKCVCKKWQKKTTDLLNLRPFDEQLNDRHKYKKFASSLFYRDIMASNISLILWYIKNCNILNYYERFSIFNDHHSIYLDLMLHNNEELNQYLIQEFNIIICNCTNRRHDDKHCQLTTWAIDTRNLTCFKHLIHKKMEVKHIKFLSYEAARSNQYAMLDYMIEAGFKLSKKIPYLAIKTKNQKLLEWITKYYD